MALDLGLVDQQPARQLEWPEHAQTGWHVPARNRSRLG
jgi:hypothetical protein